MVMTAVLERVGGPDAIVWRDIDLPPPGPGEARVRHHAVGLNFIDVYHRTGLIPTPLPGGLGMEAAGVVEAVGEGVVDLAPGDRVAYASTPLGAYAQARNMPADRLARLPDALSFAQGAAMMLQGMTVSYLITRTFKVQPGMSVLWHAAAGGVGLIACQWLRALGVTVIGTVGSEAKAELALANGCAHVILYDREDVAARVRALTDGAGVPVVYDPVGRDTFEASLNSLSPQGLLVSFGSASGPPPLLNLSTLIAKGSLFVTRPTLMDYTASRADLTATAQSLFDAVSRGDVRIEVRQRRPLLEAAAAHEDLEQRRTVGSTVLDVETAA